MDDVSGERWVWSVEEERRKGRERKKEVRTGQKREEKQGGSRVRGKQ